MRTKCKPVIDEQLEESEEEKGVDVAEKGRAKARGKRKLGEGSSGSRKKKIKNDDTKAEEQAAWEFYCETKAVTCERQVHRDSIGLFHTVVKKIHDRKMELFFKPVKGYIRGIVKSFYKNMKLQGRGTAKPHIESILRGTSVIVTPEKISNYLGCEIPDPDMADVPCPPFELANFDSRSYARTMVENFDGFNGKFSAGTLNEDYRLLNKIIQHNVYPLGNEKIPGPKGIHLMHAFMNDKKIDFGRFIFDEMVQFREVALPKANLIYPAMITEFCLQAGVKQGKEEEYTLGKPGPITETSQSKSKALSKKAVEPQPPPSPPQAESQPAFYSADYFRPPQLKSNKPHERAQEWNKLMFRRQSSILRNQKTMDCALNNMQDEVKVLKTDVAEVKSSLSLYGEMLKFCVAHIEKVAGVKFQGESSVPKPSVEPSIVPNVEVVEVSSESDEGTEDDSSSSDDDELGEYEFEKEGDDDESSSDEGDETADVMGKGKKS